MNTYDFSEYYPALEVAKTLKLEKNTILNRCRNGFYEGAIKTTKEIHPPNGQWLIPKHLIDTPHMVQDVVTITRQINPAELERSITAAITNSITQSITTVTEPLIQKIEQQNQKLSEQSTQINQLKKENDEITKTITNINIKTNMISEDTKIISTRLEKNSSKSNYGEIIIVVILVILAVFTILNITGILKIF
jgi:cell division protein FtsB